MALICTICPDVPEGHHLVFCVRFMFKLYIFASISFSIIFPLHFFCFSCSGYSSFSTLMCCLFLPHSRILLSIAGIKKWARPFHFRCPLCSPLLVRLFFEFLPRWVSSFLFFLPVFIVFIALANYFRFASYLLSRGWNSGWPGRFRFEENAS